MRNRASIVEKLIKNSSYLIDCSFQRYSYRELLDPFCHEYKEMSDQKRVEILTELKRCDISITQVINEYTERYKDRQDIITLIPRATLLLLDMVLKSNATPE